MDTIHCIQIVFPTNQEIHNNNHIDRSTMTTSVRASFQLPKIIKPNELGAGSPIVKKIAVDQEELAKISKTTIYHVEEKFSPQNSKKDATSKQVFFKKNYDSKYYKKFYDRMDKERAKRSEKKNSVKITSRDNPWRYSINTLNCVFDVNVLAEKTFSATSHKKNASKWIWALYLIICEINYIFLLVNIYYSIKSGLWFIYSYWKVLKNKK